MPVAKEVIPLAVAVAGAVTGGALFAANKTREALGEKNWTALHNELIYNVSRRETQGAIPVDRARFASPLHRLFARLGP